MFQDKILKSVADAVKDVMAEQLKGDQHKIDKNKNGKVDAHDFKLLRKEEAPKKPASPFDWKNTPRQTAEKGEKTGHDSKKISTGTVYTKRYTKEEASQAEFNAEIKKAQDKSTGKVKADVAKPAVQAVKQESVEQIDELSKSTLGSYIKKASHDVAHKGALTRQFANDSNDAKKDQRYFDAKKADDKSNKTFEKSWNRRKGMAKAVDRLTKEEIEKIDEVSLALAKRARDKASDIALRDRDSMERDKPYGHSEKQRVKFQRYVNKKAPSAADAVDPLTKEEVEILERTLTASEAEKKEDIVKGMKKNLAGFKERYGKDAKSVMYATATKNAKKD